MRRKCDDERRAAWGKALLGAALAAGVAWAGRWGAYRGNEALRAAAAETGAGMAAWVENTEGIAGDFEEMARAGGAEWQAATGAEGAAAERTAALAEDEERARRLQGEWKEAVASERSNALRALAELGTTPDNGAAQARAAWGILRAAAAGAEREVCAAGEGQWVDLGAYLAAKGTFNRAKARGEAVRSCHAAWREARERRASAMRRLRGMKASEEKRAMAEREEALGAMARAEAAGFAPDQGFGERLAAMRARLEEGAAAFTERKFRIAAEAYATARTEAEGLLRDGAARTEAERKRAVAEAARAQADRVAGAGAGQGAYEGAAREWAAAETAYEAGRFDEAGEGWTRAAEKWARAESERRPAAVRAEIAAARTAAREGRWEDVQAAAARVLDLDAGNEAAAELHVLAERQLRPTVRLTAVLDGREVAATVTEGTEAEGVTTPAEVDVAKGGIHEFAAVYEAGGKRYEGRVAVRVPERGSVEARVELSDATSTTVWLTAEAAGREVAATVTEGVAQQGVTTPVTVNLSHGGRHEFALVYEAGGKRYEGRVAVDAAAHGRTAAHAVLEEVPEIYLVAMLNGRAVNATVTDGVADAGLKTPVRVKLEKGGEYSFAAEYEEGGKRYEGRTTVRAASHGRTVARVDLEEPAPPSIALMATIGGWEVAAKVTEGLSGTGWKTPVTVYLEKGGEYPFAMEYAKDGKWYAGRTTVKAADHGKTFAWVELGEWATPTIRLEATVKGRTVAATVAEGLAQSGRKTPVDVNLEREGAYPFTLVYEEDGVRYEGRTTVQAAAHGKTTARVELRAQ